MYGLPMRPAQFGVPVVPFAMPGPPGTISAWGHCAHLTGQWVQGRAYGQLPPGADKLRIRGTTKKDKKVSKRPPRGPP
jgi:hypothetical protein